MKVITGGTPDTISRPSGWEPLLLSVFSCVPSWWRHKNYLLVLRGFVRAVSLYLRCEQVDWLHRCQQQEQQPSIADRFWIRPDSSSNLTRETEIEMKCCSGLSGDPVLLLTLVEKVWRLLMTPQPRSSYRQNGKASEVLLNLLAERPTLKTVAGRWSATDPGGFC